MKTHLNFCSLKFKLSLMINSFIFSIFLTKAVISVGKKSPSTSEICIAVLKIRFTSQFVRLGKKLIEPLTNLIHSTSAMSLLYECINTVIAVLISISTG